MDIKQFIKQLRDYLGTADAQYLLGKRKDDFINILNIIDRDSVLCEKNGIVPANQNDIDKIINSLKHLLAVLNEQIITLESSKFIDSYSTLLFNHNNNTHKNSEINLLSQTVNRFVNLRMTTVELLQNAKTVSNRMRELSRISFQPIELSKHYLSSFDKIQNNK